jgi:hypothetical protein
VPRWVRGHAEFECVPARTRVHDNEPVFEVFVVDTVDAATPGIALAVRVHAGSVSIGDRVVRATGPDGQSCPLDLEVSDLALTESIHVDTMDENYGGLAVLVGSSGSIQPGTALSG